MSLFGPADHGWTSVTMSCLTVKRADAGLLAPQASKVQIQQTVGSIDTSSARARHGLMEVFGDFTPLPESLYYTGQ